MKVLVVDDSLAARHMIKRMVLQVYQGNVEVLEAEDGSKALAQLAAHPELSIALVDWNMPVMDGLQFVMKARESVPSSVMKIVMVTTETDMERVVQALTVGADEYIMKPFNAEVLADKLRLVDSSLSN
jgi:two-component system chemotaxis response regulator CheY